MPVLKLPRVLETDIKYLVVQNTLDNDVVAINTDHIATLVVDSTTPDEVTVVTDITVPGQGNQAENFSFLVTGADAQDLLDWFAHQSRGNIVGTWT